MISIIKIFIALTAIIAVSEYFFANKPLKVKWLVMLEYKNWYVQMLSRICSVVLAVLCIVAPITNLITIGVWDDLGLVSIIVYVLDTLLLACLVYVSIIVIQWLLKIVQTLLELVWEICKWVIEPAASKTPKESNESTKE